MNADCFLHLRLRLPLRMNAPRIPYPEKIDIELPASFSNDPANHGAGSEGKKRKRNSQGLWLTEVVTPLPAGWHPDLMSVVSATFWP